MIKANVALKHETLLPVSPCERQNILILDDSSFDRLRIKREIARAGLVAHIDEISCLCHLSDALADEIYDIVIIDYFLPDGTGDDALDLVMTDENHRDARLILVSGNPWVCAATVKERNRQVEFINKSKLGYGHFLSRITARKR